MANASLKEAFNQFWLHTVARIGDVITQANKYTDNGIAEVKSYSDSGVAEAKAYSDDNTQELKNYVDAELDTIDSALSEKSDDGHTHSYLQSDSTVLRLDSDTVIFESVTSNNAATPDSDVYSDIGAIGRINAPLQSIYTHSIYTRDQDGNMRELQNILFSDGKVLAGSAYNAAVATKASSLTTDNGSATTPVYFLNGVPVACGDTLNVSITGSANEAATAHYAENASDADYASEAGQTDKDGEGNVISETYATIESVNALVGDVESLLSNL